MFKLMKFPVKIRDKYRNRIRHYQNRKCKFKKEKGNISSGNEKVASEINNRQLASRVNTSEEKVCELECKYDQITLILVKNKKKWKI